ncbi:hypothetical protein F4805DRAFT_411318 [Annulohypoxylon moriforme]|nr:hypothetical protein F4805DRAFT_411318 [Annulohypoxylon moriforme]
MAISVDQTNKIISPMPNASSTTVTAPISPPPSVLQDEVECFNLEDFDLEEDNNRHEIVFCHPCLDEILMSVPPIDSNGLHHETMRIACCIVAKCQ